MDQEHMVERIADYDFVRSLGESGNGHLYLAKRPPRLPIDVELVAVKVFGGHGGSDAFRRMTRELKLFASISSPYLVALYDAGQEGNHLYYSLEYSPDGTLEAPTRQLTRGEVLRAVAHAARAAHALHEAGVAHRDIRPGNILVYPGGGKLADLGLAQVLQPGVTVTGMAGIGSVEYMDPAMLRGERASRASDIWSLGVTLHRAVAGNGVYGDLPAGDPLLSLRRVLSTTPTIDASLPAEVSELVAACLESEPTNRPRTAEALADRLEALAA